MVLRAGKGYHGARPAEKRRNMPQTVGRLPSGAFWQNRRSVAQEAPGGSRGTPRMTTNQRAMPIRVRPTNRCPRTSVQGFVAKPTQRCTRSPRRKPGDSANDHQPTCHADPRSPNNPVSPDFRPGLCVKHALEPSTSGRRPAKPVTHHRIAGHDARPEPAGGGPPRKNRTMRCFS